MKRPTKRDADTESIEQAIAVSMLAPCVTIAFIASGNRWPPLDKRSVKLKFTTTSVSVDVCQHSPTLANSVQLKPAFKNVYEWSTTYTKVYFQTSAKFLHVKKFQQTQRSSAFASEH